MALRTRILTQHQPTVSTRDFKIKKLVNSLFSSGKEQRLIDTELADFAQALGLLAGNGLPVNVALGWLCPRATGIVAQEFSNMMSNLELGADPVQELAALAETNRNAQLSELCEKLSISIIRGAPISDQLLAQSRAARANLQRNLLRQAGSNETKMLIPVIFLILPVTVLFAIFPSISLLAQQL